LPRPEPIWRGAKQQRSTISRQTCLVVTALFSDPDGFVCTEHAATRTSQRLEQPTGAVCTSPCGSGPHKHVHRASAASGQPREETLHRRKRRGLTQGAEPRAQSAAIRRKQQQQQPRRRQRNPRFPVAGNATLHGQFITCAPSKRLQLSQGPSPCIATSAQQGAFTRALAASRRFRCFGFV